MAKFGPSVLPNSERAWFVEARGGKGGGRGERREEEVAMFFQ
jgi:hypothetical protein